MSHNILERIEKAGIIPVVVIEDPKKAIKLGMTILETGLDIIEITMRTKRAIETIRILNKEIPDLLIGAGTIFSLSLAKEAINEGARFIVSPHLDEKIITYCINHDIVCIPGVFTPSEVQRAIDVAAKNKSFSNLEDIPLILKIFPASTGGPNHIKAMKAVFPNVRFLPLGGVNPSNLADYLKVGVWAVGGTWLCKRDLIEKDEFTKISDLVREAIQIVSRVKGKRY